MNIFQIIMKKRILIYNFSILGILCFIIIGCCFMRKTEYISYEYKKIGIKLCGWSRDKKISKIIIFKNKSNDIDFGMVKNDVIIPIGENFSKTIKQLGFLPVERKNKEYCLIENNSVLTINLNDDDLILYTLNVYGDSSFVILFKGNNITIPIDHTQIKHLFGYDFIKTSYPYK